MGHLNTDFTTSSEIDDWSARWAVPGTTWSIEDDTSGSSYGDKVMKSSLVAFAVSGWSWDSTLDQTTVDTKIRVRSTSFAGGAQSIGIVGRGNEDSGGDKDGYVAYLDVTNSRLYLIKYVANVKTTLGVAYVDYKLTIYNWYWLRMNIAGTTVQCKFWEEGETEPAAWDIDVTDSDVSAAGWVGVQNLNGGGELDWIGVGHAGTAIPAVPASSPEARMTQMTVEVLRKNTKPRSQVIGIGC
jgi:hypothetical protein